MQGVRSTTDGLRLPAAAVFPRHLPNKIRFFWMYGVPSGAGFVEPDRRFAG